MYVILLDLVGMRAEYPSYRKKQRTYGVLRGERGARGGRRPRECRSFCTHYAPEFRLCLRALRGIIYVLVRVA